MTGKSVKMRVAKDFKEVLDKHSRKYNLSKVYLSALIADALKNRRKLL
jgi:hypothetical protein|tara:strand:+ start:1710 stop:1853 length:144 start_codon:yes stop_codon:yes gene_type:complete